MFRIQLSKLAAAGILTAAILLCGAQPGWSREGSQSADKPQGLQNWGRVTDTLYRGAQPGSAGFKALRQSGVAIVVNFRDESDEIAAEQRQVESLGMKYVSIPWSGHGDPSNTQVVQFLDLVRANPQAKIFVHCKRGADRTGAMIAAYRIAVEHKAVTDAVSEMHQYHYAHFWLPELERYVNSLPQLLHSSPVFSAYVPVTPKTSAPSTVPAVAAVATPSIAAVAIPAAVQ